MSLPRFEDEKFKTTTDSEKASTPRSKLPLLPPSTKQTNKNSTSRETVSPEGQRRKKSRVNISAVSEKVEVGRWGCFFWSENVTSACWNDCNLQKPGGSVWTTCRRERGSREEGWCLSLSKSFSPNELNLKTETLWWWNMDKFVANWCYGEHVCVKKKKRLWMKR